MQKAVYNGLHNIREVYDMQKKYFLIIISGIILTLVLSCGQQEKNLLERLFDLESRSKQGASPSRIDELQAAIKESQAQVEKVIAENEKLSSFWRLLTVRYAESGMFGQAFESAKKALMFSPNDAGLYYLLGVAAGNMAKTAITETANPEGARARWLSLSESAYREALKLDPKNYRSMYGIAVLYVFELDNPEAALPYLEDYLAVQQKDVDGYFLYGRALYASGRLQDAVTAYANAAKYSSVKEKRQLAEQYQKTILEELYGTK